MAKPAKVNDNSPYFVYFAALLGTGGLLSALHLLLPLSALLLGLTAWWVWRRCDRVQKNQQDILNAIFYQVIQEHQGRVTVLDLAMTAKIPAIAARRYLDDRAKEFSAHFEVSDGGDVMYIFSSLKWSSLPLPSVSQRLLETSDEKQLVEPLTQAQLARRLRVSPETIRRRKLSPTLTEWSRSRDPDKVGWSYLAQAKRFFPLN